MGKINWTFQAIEDIEAIATYLERTSPKYAEYIIDLFFEEVKILQQFPKIGRKVPETNLDMVREIIIKKYRIIYSISSTEVIDILTVQYSSFPLLNK